jgi:hypothetical protein
MFGKSKSVTHGITQKVLFSKSVNVGRIANFFWAESVLLDEPGVVVGRGFRNARPGGIRKVYVMHSKSLPILTTTNNVKKARNGKCLSRPKYAQ